MILVVRNVLFNSFLALAVCSSFTVCLFFGGEFAGKPSVKVCAYTGVAARLVSGSTLHRVFKLPVQRDGRLVELPPLTGMFLRTMSLEWSGIEFLIIDEISMVSYEILCMVDARLRQLKFKDVLFGDVNVLLFRDLMQLSPFGGNPVFKQPLRLVPATHLWRLFQLVELKENMRQQGDNTFVDILNALRVGELTADHLRVLSSKVSDEAEGEFAIDRALRIYPTNKMVSEHNEAVLNKFKQANVQVFLIKAQDVLVDEMRPRGDVPIDDIVPSDINKTGGFPQKLEIFVGAKVMLRSNVDVRRGLVNGAIGCVEEIIWPAFRRGQMYDTDIPSVRVNFEKDGVHVIEPKTIQFPGLHNYGTIERRMLPLVLCWACTVHKMQGCTVDYAVIYLGMHLFAAGQAYVALSRVRSLDGLRIQALDLSKLTGKTPCNKDALEEMNRMRAYSVERT